MCRCSFPVRVFALALLLACIAPVVRSAPAPHSRDSVDAVQRAVDRLQQWYDPQTGRWHSQGWWNDANSLTVLVDFSRVAHSNAYLPVIQRTFAANSSKDFLNSWYDDEGWWALGWIDAYDLTGNADYLHMAQTIFADMIGGWDDTCGGGIWQLRKRVYKDAIANELFLSVAAHLANRTSDPRLRVEYVSWAEREWKWFKRSGMIEPDHLISDGLSNCRDNHGTKWTYNQGVILGGLVELSRIHGGRGELRAARAIAHAAMKQLADQNGILHDSCEPKCSADSMQFKGVFMRNLAELDARSPDRRFEGFVEANAESILAKDQTADHALGQVWSGPPGEANAVAQTASLDGLLAGLEMNSGTRN